MTVRQKSVALWVGGAAVGALAGSFLGMPAGSSHHGRGAIGGALLGALLVGGLGDAYLENKRLPK